MRNFFTERGCVLSTINITEGRWLSRISPTASSPVPCEYVTSFRSLFKKGSPDSLDEWVDKYMDSPFRMFSAFAKGGEKEDRVAIKNEITNSISNGYLRASTTS